MNLKVYLKISILQLLGIILFYYGYLKKSNVNTKVSDLQISLQNKRKVKKIIFILVDALRYDFVLNQNQNFLKNNKEKKEKNYYENQLRIFEELNREFQQNTILKKIYADAPTVTLSRVKAMISGNYPNFLDFINNFQKDNQLQEDNLISQLKRHNQKTVFMGDDTWMSILNDQFDQQYPLDSFNTFDLDSVDKGVESLLFNRFLQSNSSNSKENDFDLLIGHMLGVDHAGHSYSPNSVQMQNKLSYMDKFFRKLINRLDNDTLLMVIGDHGMSENGNHGGKHYQETNSIIFSYFKQGFSQYKNQIDLFMNQKIYKQIDIVPTISYLLGISIPFSNLGKFIPLYHIDQKNTSYIEYLQQVNQIYQQNMKQIQNYLKDSFKSQYYQQIQSLEQQININYKQYNEQSYLLQQIKLNDKIVKNIQNQLVLNWQQFNYIHMIIGQILLIKVFFQIIAQFMDIQSNIDFYQIIIISIYLVLSQFIQHISFMIVFLFYFVFVSYKDIQQLLNNIQSYKYNYFNKNIIFIICVYFLRIQSLFSLNFLRNEEFVLFIYLIMISYNLFRENKYQLYLLFFILLMLDGNQLLKYSRINKFIQFSIIKKILKTNFINNIILLLIGFFIYKNKNNIFQSWTNYLLYKINFVLLNIFIVSIQILESTVNHYGLQVILPRIIYLVFIIQMTKYQKLEEHLLAHLNIFILLTGINSIKIILIFLLIQTLLIKHKNFHNHLFINQVLVMFIWLILGNRHQIAAFSYQSCFLGFTKFNPLFSFIILKYKTFGIFLLNSIIIIYFIKKYQKQIKLNEQTKFKYVLFYEQFFFLQIICTIIMNFVQIGSLLTIEEYVPRLIFDTSIFFYFKMVNLVILYLMSNKK